MIGFVDDKVYWGVISTGIINLVATAASVKLVESFGRRPLILYPLVIITVIMILLCVFIQVRIRMFLVLIIYLIEDKIYFSNSFIDINVALHCYICHWTWTNSICISK